jgi:hypothetical protein
MQTPPALRYGATAACGAVLCLLTGLAAADARITADTQSGTTAYARMAQLEQYLMNSDAEITLARSAAPAAISAKATVLTLGPQGYRTAVNGSNGFTCLVERGWMSPFDNPEFWSPKIRAPICYNPAASKSILEYTYARTRLVLSGRSREQVLAEVRAKVARKELQEPTPGAMSYMMSKDQYLGDATVHWHSHLMFHVPKTEGASWGANMPGSPVVLDERPLPEPQTIFFVPVGRWSDGTLAPAM